MANPIRLGVLGSGKGSNFGAILRAIQSGALQAEVALVLSDFEDAGILDLARGAGISTDVIREPRYRTRLSEEIEWETAGKLKAAGVDLVVLAGFMRVVREPLLEEFPDRIINIHPSLLPKYRGLEAWKQALEAGESVAGCTVHWVNREVDGGEILAQAEVPVLPDDTAESLHVRIQEQEHRLLPEVIARLAGQLA